MKTLNVRISRSARDEAYRLFNVRWLDEDRGWRSVDVAAANEDAARDSVQELIVGQNLEVRPRRAALHAI